MNKYIRNPFRILNYFAIKGYFDSMPDDTYLKIRFRALLGEKLDLSHPRSFNEKLQWLKINSRDPMYTSLVDKYAVKKYVTQKIGSDHVIPTLGVWDTFDQIDFNVLPDRFVLKCTHDSGGNIICKDKSVLDYEAARRKIDKSLNRDYWLQGREWPYKDVPRRIIAEEYIEDESGYELKDYKIFNFDGIPEFIQVDYDRYTNHKRNLYSPQWELLPIQYNYPSSTTKTIERPVCLQEMLSMARVLSEHFPFIRTDFYICQERIYFGELTFYPEGGFGIFNPSQYEIYLGDKIKLPGGV